MAETFAGFTDKQRAFLNTPLYGTIGTYRSDGTVSLFTVWYDLDGDTIWFITQPGVAKIRRLTHDPRIAFHIVGQSGFPYLAVNGTATVTMATDMQPRIHMATRYLGEEGAKGWLAQNPGNIPAIIRITTERVGGLG